MTVSLQGFFIRPVGTVIFAALILALLFVVRNNEARALFAELFGERRTGESPGISSTKLRELIANKKSARYFIPDNVLTYIKKYHLYEA